MTNEQMNQDQGDAHGPPEPSEPEDKQYELVAHAPFPEDELVAEKTPRRRRRRRRRRGKQSLAPDLPPLPESPTGEEAAAWLEKILALRKHTPKPDDPYYIPDELVKVRGAFATGPSIVKGDAPVTFRVWEQKGKDQVFRYGAEGARHRRDMPLVSEVLKSEMKRALRHLPGYTETCQISGRPLKHPLATIARKLLKGEIKEVRDIQFATVDPEANRERMRREIDASRAANRQPRTKHAQRLRLQLTPRILESARRLRALAHRSSQD